MNKSTKRNYSYDLIRAVAILLVVLCHSLEVVYFRNINLSVQSNLFYILFHSISRLGVPLFLFLSGALLLKKDFEKHGGVKLFFKHNLLNLIIVIEIWYVLYYLLDVYVFGGGGEPLEEFVPVLFFLKQYPLSHAWYLPVIIGLYATIPFVGVIAKKYEKILKIILAASVFYIFLIPMINIILVMFKVDYQIPNTFSIPFGGAWYGVYLLLGYYISKNYERYNKKYLNSFALAAIFMVSLAATVFIRYKLHCDSWYDMLTILICSTCLYLMLLRIRMRVLNKGFMFLSVLSFGVYLIHKPIIDLLDKLNFIDDSDANLPVQSIMYFVLTVGISYVAIYLISRVKPLRKYLLFIK